MRHLITMLAIGGVIFTLLQPVYRTSQRLIFTAQRYADGELDQRIDVKDGDPFGDVLHQFNRWFAL